MDPFIQRMQQTRINGRYTLVEKLAEGGYGVVYLARDAVEDKLVALKLEHRSLRHSVLNEEVQKYRDVEGLVGFPRILWAGRHDHFRVMALELLGPSLQDVFAYCGHRFSLKTTLMVADQLIVRLEELHGRALIHRDIKPRNCLLGNGERGNIIYLADLGLADHPTVHTAQYIEQTNANPILVGTADFASIAGHQGRGQSPRDDLESLGYMLVYLVKGRLPWQGREDDFFGWELAIMREKRVLPPEQLCEGLPATFTQYIREVKALRDGEEPDYGRFRDMFRELAEANRFQYDDVYDWTIRSYFDSGRTEGARDGN